MNQGYPPSVVLLLPDQILSNYVATSPSHVHRKKLQITDNFVSLLLKAFYGNPEIIKNHQRNGVISGICISMYSSIFLSQIH